MMVILGHLITGTLEKRGGEFRMELNGGYNDSVKDAVIKLLPQMIEMFDKSYTLKVELTLEEMKTTTSNSVSHI